MYDELNKNISDGDTRKTLLGDNRIMATSSMLYQHKKLRMLERVEAALGRLEAGTYGFCTGCGDEIDVDALVVDPSISTCSACKKKNAA